MNEFEVVEDVTQAAQDSEYWNMRGSSDTLERYRDNHASVPRIEFDHNSTEGVLSLEFEGDEVTAWIAQSYDSDLNEVTPESDGFCSNLLSVYDEIDHDLGEGYTQGTRDNMIDVSTALIPAEYDEARVHSTFQSMGRISEAVDSAHIQVDNTVDDLLDNPLQNYSAS